MDSHITGPFYTGQGAVVSTRGMKVEFGVTPEKTFEFGIVKASPQNPVLIELFMTDEITFDATGGPVIYLEARSVANPGIIYANFNYFRDIVGGYTGLTPQPSQAVVEEDTIITLTYAHIDATTGRVHAVVKASGLGQPPI